MSEEHGQPPPLVPAADLSAWAPIKRPVFRMLWSTWLVANICMWMNDVAAAWMMTSMTTSPIWVALVQSASTLPVFLLGLPSGALADILDRRRYFIMTQFWVAGVATLLSVTVISGVMTPPLLLALTLPTAWAWRCAGRCSPPSFRNWCRACSCPRRWRSTGSP